MAKKRPMKKRSDFATAKAYQTYKKRSASRKKARTAKSAAILHAQKVLLVNLEPSIRGLMARLDNLTLDESKRVILALQAQNAAEQLTAGFVDDYEIARLRKNMAIALEPSRLRHMGSVTDEMEKMQRSGRLNRFMVRTMQYAGNK